jgi:gliding motility-associated-like protein
VPKAYVRKDICYALQVETVYGCKGSDSICINVFCENTQVFIPNAFTPDGDGLNDILMVRGTGIKMVKQFTIFNRWGQVVFERQNFMPNDPAFGWNGYVNGVKASPDVFVYIADVVCENDTHFAYKGNVTIIK